MVNFRSLLGRNGLCRVSHDQDPVLTLSYLTAPHPIRDNPPTLTKGDREMDANYAANECNRVDQVVPSHLLVASLLVISDDPGLISGLRSICDWLEMRLEIASPGINAGIILRQCRPTAVVFEADGDEQDGFHIMKQIAIHDRTLPAMVLTHGDPTLAGAVDAVQDLWGLTGATQPASELTVSELMEFLAKATRRTGVRSLMSI
jgi:ActR/RegA family two-component response regulator